MKKMVMRPSVKRMIAVAGFVMTACVAHAQISGPSTATPNQSSVVYTVTDINYAAWSFQAVGGTVTLSSKQIGGGSDLQQDTKSSQSLIVTDVIPPGGGDPPPPPPPPLYTYTATVTWGAAGTGTLKFLVSGTVTYTETVYICAAVTPNPGATFVVDAPGCGSTPITYSGAKPANTNWYWQSTASGTSTTNSGTTYKAPAPGVYYLRAQSICGTWSAGSIATPLVATVNPLPAAPTVTNSTACPLSTFNFSGTPGANGNNINWYWASTGGVSFAQGTTASFTDVDGDYGSSMIFYASSVNTTTGCESTTRKPLTVTFKTTPAVPTSVTGGSTCGPGTVALSSVPSSGNTVHWYGANWYTAPGTPLLASTNSYTTPSLGVTTNYYVRSYNATTGCESVPMTATATVIPIPGAPTVPTPNSLCISGTVTITATPGAGGTNVNWFNAPSHGSFLYHGTTISPTLSATTTYYAETIFGSCTSASRTPVTITVNPEPMPSGLSSTGFCAGGGTSVITGSPGANGTTLRFYDGPLGSGILVATALSYTTPVLMSSKTYYVASYNASTGCESANDDRTPVTVTANPAVPVPAAPIVPFSENPCGPKSVTQNGKYNYAGTVYWQTSPTGTSTSSSANSISVSTDGTSTYYLRALGGGCWSNATSGVTVTVDNPDAPTLSKNSYIYCEADEMTMAPVNTTPYPGMHWVNLADNQLYDGTSCTPTNLNNGTYTYKVVNVSAGGCESDNYATVTLQVGGPTANCDQYINWQESISYTYADANDVTGTIAVNSKVYSDGFGKAIQSQTKSMTNNMVFASESIYDKSGNQTLTTLPAPINSSTFAYRYRFTTKYDANTSTYQKYSWTDFDKPISTNAWGEVNKPIAVANNGIGTLGWYYSSANSAEPATATTSYPYARNYTPPGPNPVTSKSAGPGNMFRMGNTHESQSDKTLITGSDLTHYYSLRSYFNLGPYYTNSTPINFTDAPSHWPSFVQFGNTSVTTVSNLVYVGCGPSGSNPGAYPINGTIAVTPGTLCTLQVNAYSTGSSLPYLHVTDGSGNDIQWGATPIPNGTGTPVLNTLNFTVPVGVTSVKIGVQWKAPATSAQVYISSLVLQIATASSAPLGNPGYKIISTSPDGKRVASFTDADGNSLASAVVTSAIGVTPVAYDNTTWSYNYYNDLGQLVASVAPNGVTYGSPAAMPNFVTTYKYDHLGRLIETTSPDEGTSQYVYSTDGKIRFSQNNEQRTSDPNHKRFSYTNYDYLGRLIESGEYTFATSGDYVFDPAYNAPSVNSVLNIIDNVGHTGVTGFTGDTHCTDVTFIDYDVLTDFASDGVHTVQNNLTGQVARTKNANATTWYSYDEFGHVEWTVQNITGFVNKTIDYNYDFLGNVTQVAYQKGQSDAFFHYYTYDADNRLTSVSTGFTVNGATTTQAKYYYYLHGPLKRVELGDKIQGIDYTYNIDGSLKAINHADQPNDPGADGYSGANSSFMKDAFGMALDYYNNDYVPAATNTLGSLNPSGTTDQFSGLIKSQRWHSQVDNHVQRAYAYNYDNQNRFSVANFGSVTGGSGNYSFSSDPQHPGAYKEAIGGYDNNGNISALNRNNKVGTTLVNNVPKDTYGYTYNYTPNKNQLASITGSTTINYIYNTIGQMTQQTEDSRPMKVAYNAYGLTKEVRDGTDNLMEQYFYDDRGDQVKKIIYNAGALYKTTYYVRDANGNPMAIYEQNGANAMALTEQPIYGAGRIGMMKPKSGTPKYFYEVNDHLGNVRAVVGDPTTDKITGTYEPANANVEQHQFVRYDNAKRIQSSIFDYTNGNDTGYSERLNGDTNEKYGLAASLSVMPGDVISAQVFAKYVDTNHNDWAPDFVTLMGQIAANAAGVVIDGSNYGSSTSSFPFPGLLNTTGSIGTGPKAYLNWLIFDKNFAFTTGGFTRLSDQPREYGQDVNHEQMLMPDITITEPGYMYIYLSNENDTPVEVYFDDFKVTQVHSRVVAGGDFYPFGLQQTERQITQERYRFGYQGQFSEYDSLTKTNQFQLRLYDPRFGRWLSPDPYNIGYSPYIGMGNNPVGLTDPDGGCPFCFALSIVFGEDFAALFDQAYSDFLDASAGFTDRITRGGAGAGGVDLGFASEAAASSFNRGVDLSVGGSLQVPTLAPEISPMVYSPVANTGTLTAWEPGALQQWGMSTSFIGSATYSIADDFFTAIVGVLHQRFLSNKIFRFE